MSTTDIPICSNCVYIYAFQLRLEVFDTVYPDNRAVEYVTIEVNRNQNAPEFEDDSELREEIDANFPLITEMFRVPATDDDNVSNTENVEMCEKI